MTRRYAVACLLLALLLLGLGNRVVNRGGAGPVTAAFLDSDSGYNTSYSLDFSGSSNGDLLFYVGATRGSHSAPTTPAGFTLLTSPSSGSGVSDSTTYIYYKTADGTETTITLTLSAIANSAAFAVAFSNAATSAPAYTNSNAQATSFTLTGQTVPANGMTFQAVCVRDSPNNNTIGAPGSVAVLGSETTGVMEGIVSYEDTVGATGNLSYTFGDFSYWSGSHIVIDPE